MSKMNRQLTDSEINHLRRLIGWIECEIGQAPDEMIETLKKVSPALGHDFGEESRLRLEAAYAKSAAVPLYVRAAIKALRKTLVKHNGEIVDVDSTRTVQHIEK